MFYSKHRFYPLAISIAIFLTIGVSTSRQWGLHCHSEYPLSRNVGVRISFFNLLIFFLYFLVYSQNNVAEIRGETRIWGRLGWWGQISCPLPPKKDRLDPSLSLFYQKLEAKQKTNLTSHDFEWVRVDRNASPQTNKQTNKQTSNGPNRRKGHGPKLHVRYREWTNMRKSWDK